MKFTAVLAAAVVSAASSFRQYPLYKQCDPRWGSDEMGTSTNGTGERATVCKEGCAMSSLSMALAGLGATIDGSLVTPGIFNLWLEVNNGYLCLSGDCNNLVLDAVTRLNSTIQLVGENPKPTIPVIRAGLDRGDTIYIAHVPKLVHFVLLTNYTDAESDWFTVNDAFYNSTGYMWSNFSDIIIYNIVPKAAMSPPPAVSGSLVASSQSGVFRVPSAEDGPRVAPEIVATAGIAPGAAPVIPFKYPLMKQCGMPYSNNKMVNATICQVGCLMSSVAMALNFNKVLIGGQAADPGTFNEWLRTNGGYVGDSSLEESVVPKLAPSNVWWPKDADHRNATDLPRAVLVWMLTYGRPVIANVMKGGHFVLVTGYDSADVDIVYVNDPGFNTTAYSISKDVVGWRIFDMLPVA